MMKLTSRQKVMIKRVVFTCAIFALIAIAGIVVCAGLADLVFEPYSSIKKTVGALMAAFGAFSIVGLFEVWNELILTNTYKKDR